MIIAALQLLLSIYLIFIFFAKSLGHPTITRKMREMFFPLLLICFHLLSVLAFTLLIDIPLMLYVLSLMAVLTYCLSVTFRVLVKIKISPRSIIEAMDNLPVGLSFTTKEGFPLLTGRKMYQLVKDITDSFYLNGEEFWKYISKDCTEGNPLVSLKDGSVWQFTKEDLKYKGFSYTQITATDISQLDRLTGELNESNKALEVQFERLKKLSEEIEEIKKEEQVLVSKMGIHDALGQNILLGNILLEKSAQGDITQKELSLIFQDWESLLHQLSAGMELHKAERDAYMIQLVNMAETLDIKIDLQGDFPKNEIASHLIFAAIKEAVSNAVRHGKADLVTVNLLNRGNISTASITDNGKGHKGIIREKGGLKNLRRRVGIIVNIPVSEREKELC